MATLPWLPTFGWLRGIQVVGWLALMIGLAILGFEPIRNGGGPGQNDNRTGLALLIELARIWPKAARAHVDIRFVGVSGPCESKVVWPKPGPSLVIELVNPGLGSLLSLGGTESTVKAACDAARDLWIPFFMTIPHHDTEPQWLTIEGIREPKIPDDPASLGRAAQFVVEFVLRWGKHQMIKA